MSPRLGVTSFLPLPPDWLSWDSPWAPLAISAIRGLGKGPGTYPLQFEEWLRWRQAFGARGGFRPCTDLEVATYFAEPDIAFREAA